MPGSRLLVLAALLPLLGGSLSPLSGSPAAAAAVSTTPASTTTATTATTPTAPSDPNDPGPTGHEASQGLTLVGSSAESVTPGPACAPGTPLRAYSIVAIGVDITLNGYLDHDPDGRMYVTEADLPRVRAEEAANKAARDGAPFKPGVSVGLQSDAIQPLTLRVLPGECLRITLRNDLPNDEPVSLHLHDSSLRVMATGRPAIATEPSALAANGATVSYEWAVPAGQPEGTSYFHSEALTRLQTDHGLFGAVIVEPPGSRWLDPLTGQSIETGWQAMIADPTGPDFREFAVYYHEVGDENTQILDAHGGFVPIVDPVTKAYRPGTRALDYRSEPFSNRLTLQAALGGQPDESVAYSSYAFGDPATPILRSYREDPTKERIIHGGAEVAHVAHVHGGAVRWRRNPGAEPADFATGIEKHPPLIPVASERTDAQALGPSETFDVAHECGAGGCQGSVGDFLYHCHIGEHYFAGMWGLWRVYDTLQDGVASTDELPPLQPLPDRVGGVVPAVTSDALVGQTVDPGTGAVTVTATSLAGLVQGQLPPRGVPGSQDASVMDWSLDGSRYLGEPETDAAWPGYHSPAPGSRPALLFDPRSGRLAYPFLHPHLGKRPPFAPQHGPAPFLDPPGTAHDPPAPGADGPASLCPTGTQPRQMGIVALSVPVPLDPAQNLVDPAGELYVLRDQVADVLADPAKRVPLVIRANAGEDCIDATLTSRLNDTSGANVLSKVGLHIHFVQFDVQGSDGLDAGFNYEQTIQPWTRVGRPLANAAVAGSTHIELAPATPASGVLQAGALVGVGIDSADGFEIRAIVAVNGAELVLDAPLSDTHPAGQIVSTEFVHYRWYPDAQVGTSYFHDHVNGLSSWRHGLFGALVVEPPGSTYHDPHDGSIIESGLAADIHTHAPVSADVTGSFRETVLCVIDGTDIDRIGRSTGSAIDLRAEPLDGRGGDPALLFSSTAHGDPATPLIEAYVGDPLVLRTLASATNDIHTIHVDGHQFRIEPWSLGTPLVSTASVGISERYDLVIAAAGGPGRRAGDYLYRNGRPTKLREGSWGILRVLDRARAPTALEPLPERAPVAAATGDVCPLGAPRRAFDVHAIALPLPMLRGASGLVYALAKDVAALSGGAMAPQPLVLHVDVGDCLDVRLTNDTTAGAVSFHVDQLVSDPLVDGGITLGDDAPQTTAVGATSSYHLYADPGIGETVGLISDYGNVLTNPALGLYGAIVVGAPGARYLDPVSGADVAAESRASVVVSDVAGTRRDVSLFFEDSDQSIGTHRMPYTVKVAGTSGLSYQVAKGMPAPGMADPPTPLLEAFAGDPLRIHVLAPFSDQAQVFSVEGHAWQSEPGMPGSRVTDSQLYGGLQALNLDIPSAGGPLGLPGDYVYGDHRMPYAEAGLWGILRVMAPGTPSTLLPLAAAGGIGSR